ncbi:hypothetical protein M7I_4163 [Glarea lozoyensis 74030]|uniref:Uncharacterized protein n=1 Tax=Glarea lozoyensis (strain ATCC 74030 / MF5533) TaxID=1104152 RepID=H0ENF9_GLAL7|nr:hypothetical protein M7I_4163 [Glarea lozoyensis 74030]
MFCCMAWRRSSIAPKRPGLSVLSRRIAPLWNIGRLFPGVLSLLFAFHGVSTESIV